MNRSPNATGVEPSFAKKLNDSEFHGPPLVVVKGRDDKASRQIVFDGVQLNAEAAWRVRDEYFPQR